MVWQCNLLLISIWFSMNRMVFSMRGGLPGQKDDILWGNLTRADYAKAWAIPESQNIAVLETTGADAAKVFKWPDNTLYYAIPRSFPESGRAAINNAVNFLRSTTCVEFREIPMYSRKDYLVIMQGTGCASHIGMVGGEQKMHLAAGCWSIGTIYHEFMHALGFDHEQTRPDRDSYVEIHWSNIRDGYENQFTKYPSNLVNLQGIDYDYGSVMHYGDRDFGRGEMPTITILRPYPDGSEVTIGVDTISEKDKLKINRWYNCPGTSPDPTANSTENATGTQGSTTTITPGPVSNPCVITEVKDTKYVNCFLMAERRGCSVPRIRGACQATCGSLLMQDVNTRWCAAQSVRKGCCNDFIAGSCYTTCKQSSFP